jgi:hypothetical protein
MQGAFEKFGQAFTKTGDVRQDMMTQGTRMAPWREQGAKVAGALEQRWHTMEYENFQAAAVEPYMDQKKMLLRDYKQLHEGLDAGVWTGPDGMQQQIDVTSPGGREQLIRLRGQLEKDFYGRNSDMDLQLFNAANKYAQNPMVNKRIEMIVRATSDQLSRATNPKETLAAENVMSEISYRERTAAANEMGARAQASQAKQEKRPKDMREALKHQEIGPEGIMQWMKTTEEGKQFLYGSQGADAFRKSRLAMQKQILKNNPSLKDEPGKVEEMLLGLEGRIRNMAAASLLKENAPKAYEAAKLATPHFFDFEKAGTPSPDGKLKPTDARGIKGDKRMTKASKKKLFNSWKETWRTHLDVWMSDPANPADPQAAMAHMEEWLKDAVVNGGEGIDPAITIAYNQGTKELRAELISSLLSAGGRQIQQQSAIAEKHPVASLFGGGDQKIRAGKFGAPARAARERKRKSLLED